LMFYARCCRQHRRPRCRRQWGEAWWPRRRSRRRGWFMWRLAMWATQVDRALWLAAQQPSPSPAARAVWLLRRQKRDRAADRVSGRSGPPSVTDVHTCTRNDCPRVRSCFVRVTDTLYFPCREQSPNSAEQQPLNADAASAPRQLPQPSMSKRDSGSARSASGAASAAGPVVSARRAATHGTLEPSHVVLPTRERLWRL